MHGQRRISSTRSAIRLREIQGKHHSMFVDAAERDGAGLSRVLGGAQPRRISRPANTSGSARAASEIWIQASYNPILDLNGKPFKVVKYATDITAQVIARMKSETRPRHDGVGRGRRRGIERLGPRDFRGDGQVEGNRGEAVDRVEPPTRRRSG